MLNVSDNELFANVLNRKMNADRRQREMYDINPDSNSDLRIRLASINNFSEVNYQNKHPLDLTNVYNNNTNRVVIKWLQGNHGGIIAGDIYSGDWIYNPDNDTYKVKDRKDIYTVTSNQPCVDLTSPFIWTGNGRSCGFNYVPPNNSIAMIGKRDTGQSLILGYIPSNPKVLYPKLKPGEVSISGYGNNFMHFGQSDQITIYCKSDEGEYDLNDNDYNLNKENCKKNVSTCELEININANDRFIEILATEDSKNLDNTNYNKLSSYSKPVTGKTTTKIIIRPDGVDMTSEDKNNSCQLNIWPTQIYKEIRHESEKTIEQQTKGKIYRYIKNKNKEVVEESNIDKISRMIKKDDKKSIEEMTFDRIYREVYKDDDQKSFEEILDDKIHIKTDLFKVEANNIDLNKITSENDDIYIKCNSFTVKSKESIKLNSDNTMKLSVPLNKSDIHDEDDNEHKITLEGCRIENILPK